jgi:2-iminoacetate synthase ThiH
VIYDKSLDELLHKVWEGKRVSQTEALRLYSLPLEELGALADRRRQLAKANDFNGRGNQVVTYIVDRNVNYTNVCNVYCKFCAFYRVEKDDDAYVITLDEMDKKIEETVALGGTQILMQGGHHPKLTKQWYLDLLAHIKMKWPQVNIHGFSPSEFIHFREVFNEPLEKIIGDFAKAGLGSIPGGGGEILVDRVRQRISPLKAMSDDWLEVMDVAHRLGLYSSATMMFGHVETIEDRIEHLERLRAQQDISLKRRTDFQHAHEPSSPPRQHPLPLGGEGRGENSPKNSRIEPRNLTLVGGLLSNSSCPLAVPSPLPLDGRGEGQGEVRVHGEGAGLDFEVHGEVEHLVTPVLPGHFTAFICWTFQAEHTKLKAPTVGAHEYLRTQALGRIYLDNFTNVQSSWVTQGQEIGQIALKYGANDLGSIMIEENVVSQAGTTFRMTVADMQRLIKDLGYEPHQRDNWYRLLN